MKTKFIMKTNLKIAFMIIFAISISACEKDSLDTNASVESFNKSNNNKVSVPVVDHTFTVIPGTSSTLHRTQNGITVNFKTSGLIPGNAYTMWWVIWNKPNECEDPGHCIDTDFPNGEAIELDVLYAAGHIAGASGTGNFSAHLSVGDNSGSLFGADAPGLKFPQSSEVHLVLRSHGPAQPGMTDDQIHTVGGGCTTDPGGFGPDPTEDGHCRDIQAAIHSPVPN